MESKFKKAIIIFAKEKENYEDRVYLDEIDLDELIELIKLKIDTEGE